MNYRMQEQPGYATLLYQELTSRFGDEAVFLASASIQAGDDFARSIYRNLRQCTILLAVIGNRWLEFGSVGREHVRDGTFDWVHTEIAEAFRLGVRVIPVLIDDADLPDETALSLDIAALSRCQYTRLRHYSIRADLAQLIEQLDTVTPTLRDRRPTDAVAQGPPRLYQVRHSPSPRCRIALVPGDIRRVRSVDVWVNSENTDMQMARVTEFSTSAAIRYWGAERDATGRVLRDAIADDLAAQVGAARPVAPGTVVVTEAGALTASNNVRHILHVASVQGQPGAGFTQVRDIGWCVTNALSHATMLAKSEPAVRSVLLPLLGTGVGGGALVPTARSMVLAAVDHIGRTPESALRLIAFLAYTEREFTVFSEVLRDAPVNPVGNWSPAVQKRSRK